jgi:hypothetical protein
MYAALWTPYAMAHVYTRRDGYARMQMGMRLEVLGGGWTSPMIKRTQTSILIGQMEPQHISQQTIIGTKLVPHQQLLPLLARHPPVFMVPEMTDTGALDSAPGHQSSFNFKTLLRDTIGPLQRVITQLPLHQTFSPRSPLVWELLVQGLPTLPVIA